MFCTVFCVLFSFIGHSVDALASRADEGRCGLRYAPGSWRASFDPGVSEWGNPARVVLGHHHLNVYRVVGGTRGSPCICFKKHKDATPCRAWRHVALFAPTVGMPVAGASSRRNSYHRHRMADRHEIAPDRAILPENVSIRNRRPVWWPRPEATGRPRPGFRPAAVGPVVRNGTPGQAGGDTSPRNMDERGQHSCRVWLAEHPGYKHGSGAGPGTAQTAPAGRIAG